MPGARRVCRRAGRRQAPFAGTRGGPVPVLPCQGGRIFSGPEARQPGWGSRPPGKSRRDFGGSPRSLVFPAPWACGTGGRSEGGARNRLCPQRPVKEKRPDNRWLSGRKILRSPPPEVLAGPFWKRGLIPASRRAPGAPLRPPAGCRRPPAFAPRRPGSRPAPWTGCRSSRRTGR